PQVGGWGVGLTMPTPPPAVSLALHGDLPLKGGGYQTACHRLGPDTSRLTPAARRASLLPGLLEQPGVQLVGGVGRVPGVVPDPLELAEPGLAAGLLQGHDHLPAAL